MKIKSVGLSMRLEHVSAEVYEGVNKEFFLRIFETKHDDEVCLDANEAESLRMFLVEVLDSSAQRFAKHE